MYFEIGSTNPDVRLVFHGSLVFQWVSNREGSFFYFLSTNKLMLRQSATNNGGLYLIRICVTTTASNSSKGSQSRLRCPTRLSLSFHNPGRLFQIRGQLAPGFAPSGSIRGRRFGFAMHVCFAPLSRRAQTRLDAVALSPYWVGEGARRCGRGTGNHRRLLRDAKDGFVPGCVGLVVSCVSVRVVSSGDTESSLRHDV